MTQKTVSAGGTAKPKNNDALTGKIRGLVHKNKCFDLFQKTKVGQYMMYEDKPMKNIISYKMSRKIKDELSMKLKLMKGLGVF